MEELWRQTRLLPHLSFAAPERALWAIPLLFALLFLPVLLRRGGRRLLPALFLRVLLALALLAALLQPVAGEATVRRGRVLVLADVSASVGKEGRAEEREWLSKATGPFDLICFAREPGALQRQVAGSAAVVGPAGDASATDLGAALRAALLSRPDAPPARVVVLSDGRATVPGWRQARGDLERHGIEVRAVAVPRREDGARKAACVRALRPAPRGRAGDPWVFSALLSAQGPSRRTLALYVDGAPAARRSLSIPGGLSSVSFDPLPLGPGVHHVEALLLEGPWCGPAFAFSRVVVPKTPRVLLLSGGKKTSLLQAALVAQGIHARTVAAAAAPFSGQDVVVLLPGADAAALEKESQALSRFVGQEGGGLLAIGGADGPGLARLAGTPVSFLLPLDVPPRPPEKQPEKPAPQPKPKIEIERRKEKAYPISLCLLVDRSGSMQGEKIEFAKRAALAAADALTPKDRISVVAFGDDVDVLLPPSPAGNPADVALRLRPLQAKGQTSMFHALVAAYKLLHDETAPIRHVVLLSDGRPTDSGPWRDLILRMASEKITFSTVGIGFDIDTFLMGRFAAWGHGRYWSTNNARDIPQIVTQDTLRIVKARAKRRQDAQRSAPGSDHKSPERKPEPPTPPAKPHLPPPASLPPLPLVPVAAAPRDALAGLADKELPSVAAVEKGTLRFSAWTAATAGKEGPAVLAYWRVGLGTAACWTADPASPANRALRDNAEFPRLFAQLVRSLAPDAPGEPVRLTFTLHPAPGGGTLSVGVQGEDGRERTDLDLLATLQQGDAPALLPVLRRGGRYEVALPPRTETGLLTVALGPKAAPISTRSVALPVSPPAEEARGPDEKALAELDSSKAPETVGSGAPALLTAPLRRGNHRLPLSLPFLVLAALLLPLEAWARRRLS